MYDSDLDMVCVGLIGLIPIFSVNEIEYKQASDVGTSL